MIEIGRAIVKTAGREKGMKGLIVDVVDRNFVLVDGELKRRKCNVDHIEMLPQKLEIAKNAARDDVLKAMLAAKLIEKIPEFKEKIVEKPKAEKKAEKPKAKKAK